MCVFPKGLRNDGVVKLSPCGWSSNRRLGLSGISNSSTPRPFQIKRVLDRLGEQRSGRNGAGFAGTLDAERIKR